MGREPFHESDRNRRDRRGDFGSSELGPGLLERVYADALAIGSRQAGLLFVREAPVPISLGDRTLRAFKADFIVDNLVLVEVKSVERLAPVHFAQVRSYLRLAGLHKGLLINFNVAVLRQGIKSVVA